VPPPKEEAALAVPPELQQPYMLPSESKQGFPEASVPSLKAVLLLKVLMISNVCADARQDMKNPAAAQASRSKVAGSGIVGFIMIWDTY
jgi:hypothetical protein